jgi:hypothetical protein
MVWSLVDAFLAAAAGAAIQVVVEVTRFVARRAPGGLRAPHPSADSWPVSR